MRKIKINHLLIAAIILLFITLTAAIGLALTLFFSEKTVEAFPVEAEPNGSDASEMNAYDASTLYQTIDGALERADGSELWLHQLRGQPVVMLFWSSWCGDCKDYFEGDFERAFAAAEAAGARALLVCREGIRNDDRQQAEAALKEHGIDGEVFMDMQAAVYAQTGLHSVPSYAILDEEGRLMYAGTKPLDEAGMASALAYAQHGAQAQTLQFIEEKLMSASGGVASSYRVEDGAVVHDDVYLSESQGLMLLYAVQSRNRELFERVFGFVQGDLTVNGLTPWKREGDEKPAKVNAALDDLRILEALLEAQEIWDIDSSEILYRAKSLYRANVKDGYLMDYASTDLKSTGESVTLCYLDVATLRRLAELDARYAAVAEKSAEVLQNGLISESFPLYYPSFTPDGDGGEYCGKQVQMNEAMVAVLNAVRAKIASEQTLRWIEKQMEDGGIYAAYTIDGEPADGYRYESSATYALIVQIALEADRPELALNALRRLERVRCFEQPMLGSYGSVRDSKGYSFDVIEALIAWQKVDFDAGI